MPQVLEAAADFVTLAEVVTSSFKNEFALILSDNELFDQLGPMDRAFEGPQMVVLVAPIIVNVRRGDRIEGLALIVSFCKCPWPVS